MEASVLAKDNPIEIITVSDVGFYDCLTRVVPLFRADKSNL